MHEYRDNLAERIAKTNFGSIPVEEHWRRPATVLAEQTRTDASVLFARWTCLSGDSKEFDNDNRIPYHTVAINLRCTSLVFSHSGRALHDGRLIPGAIQVATPGAVTRAVFREPCDVLH